MSNNTTVHIKTLGCRTNQEEMTSLHFDLKARGYDLSDEPVGSDVMILNTCSVTQCTESKTKRMLQSISKKSPHTKILVTGCLAQQSPDELNEIPGVNWVVGNACKSEIPKIIEEVGSGVIFQDFNGGATPVASFETKIMDALDSGRTRFSLKIQEGCNYKCAFCIVPILRGPSRVVTREEVLKRAQDAVDSQFKELVLTGTHIGQYRDGHHYRIDSLIKDILAIGDDFRVRLSSLDPRDFTDDLAELMLKEERVCGHIHMSMQSFHRDVLKGMKRLYLGYDAFRDRLDHYMKADPHASVGGDFIVGFPGETDEAFQYTCDVIKNYKFSYGHVFRYSVRPGTSGAIMGDQIDEKIKIERSEKMRSMIADLRRAFIEQEMQREHTIIVEKSGPVRGITSNYIRVEIPEMEHTRNEWLKVRLRSFDERRNICIGEAVL